MVAVAVPTKRVVRFSAHHVRAVGTTDRQTDSEMIGWIREQGHALYGSTVR